MLFILLFIHSSKLQKNVCSLLLVYQALCRALWAIRTVTFLCICTCIILLYLYYFICILFCFSICLEVSPTPSYLVARFLHRPQDPTPYSLLWLFREKWSLTYVYIEPVSYLYYSTCSSYKSRICCILLQLFDYLSSFLRL